MVISKNQIYTRNWSTMHTKAEIISDCTKSINYLKERKLCDAVGSTQSASATDTTSSESARPLIQPTSTAICYGN